MQSLQQHFNKNLDFSGIKKRVINITSIARYKNVII
jgi:hypothetical protein